MSETIAPLAFLTLLAGGGGAFLGVTLASAPTPSPVASIAPACSAHEKNGHGVCEETATPAGAHDATPLQLKTLAPIVTNLGTSEKTWIRLQSALVYDAAAMPHPEILFAQIMSDTVAYLRTQSVASLEGAEGLRRLQEDLTERVSIRSEGRVREFIIETMVVQ